VDCRWERPRSPAKLLLDSRVQTAYSSPLANERRIYDGLRLIEPPAVCQIKELAMFNLRFSERSVKIAAFAAIYLIWGSTYLAIRLLAETLPGVSMVGFRFVVAGILLFAWAWWRKAPRPTRSQWRSGWITGVLMLAGGTGGVVVAIRYLDSGLVALLVAMVPLWIALLMWFWPGGQAPSWTVVGALGIGLLGAAILAAPGDVLTGEPIHLPALLVLMLACLSWAAGSLYSRKADLPKSPHLISAMQMLAGGIVLVVAGALEGEWSRFELQAVSWTSILAFLYLVVFGSLVAFSAYSWLIRTVEPTLVATYAYVNPVVAVFLGWLIADEPIGARTVIAAILIIGSVILVTTANARRKAKLAAAATRQEPVGPETGLGKVLAEKCA
jgi:drug/metabolite transporter (DMT)-like permease